MVIQAHSRVSVEEFEHIAALPENRDRHLEYIGGEIIEVVSNSLSSQIAMSIGARITLHVATNHLGYVTGADGGYRVSGEDYMPDVGFIAKAQHPERPRVAWVPYAPDLAVEVVSPSDGKSQIADKAANYMAAGTVVWYVYPDEQIVKVYEPGTPVKTLTLKDTLDGGKALPGFTLPLEDIFPTDT